MKLERLKQLVIGGAAVATLALGSSAIAGAAADSSGSSPTMATLHASSGGQPTPAVTLASVGAGTTGAMNHVRDSQVRNPRLTDHELYVIHHQRLASLA